MRLEHDAADTIQTLQFGFPAFFREHDMTNEERIKTLEQRIDELEQKLSGKRPDESQQDRDTIRAKKLEIVDGEGRVAVSISCNDGDGCVETYNSHGNSIVILGSKDGRGWLGITNGLQSDVAMVALTGSEVGGGAILTTNHSGQTLVEISATNTGAGCFAALNQEGHAVWETSTDVDGNGQMHVCNSAGKFLVAVTADEDGHGLVAVEDGGGNECVSIGVGTRGDGYVKTRHKSGTELCAFQATMLGYMGVITTNGAIRIPSTMEVNK